MVRRRQPKDLCPCTSGAPYRRCCRPVHRGLPAPDAPRLVRARFAAFALGDGAFLFRTLHPDHPLRAGDEARAIRALGRERRRLRYLRLDLLDAEEAGARARVLFTATVFERGRDRSFSELSTFARVDGEWRYLEGRLSAPLAHGTIPTFPGGR